jgi:hypothetical protein
MDNSANIAPLIRKIPSSLAVHPTQQRCPECKTMMQHLDGLFWVIDAQPRWEVSAILRQLRAGIVTPGFLSGSELAVTPCRRFTQSKRSSTL